MNMASHPQRRSAAPRIQIFVSDLSATGVVRNALAIANQAAASGYEVRLLTCRPDGVLRSQLRADVTLVKLLKGADSGRARRLELKQALAEYRRHTRRWRPDVMLSAGNHGHLLSTFAWLGLPGAKVLRISNDLAHGSPSAAVRLWRDLKFRMISGLADRLVLVSRAHGAHPLLARHLATGKALVIPNGVDVEAVRAACGVPCPHPWTGDDSIPTVLAVGRHVQQKNFDTLLRAFAVARARQPMRLLFLGGSNKAEMARLASLARELAIRDAIDFIPPTANPFPYMAAAHVVALPSLWEGSSNVLLEAMACGTPVIASLTAGDAGHVLGEGKFGVLVDPHDVEGLAGALVRQTDGHPIGPGARASLFGRSNALNHYVRMFDQLVEAKSDLSLQPA